MADAAVLIDPRVGPDGPRFRAGDATRQAASGKRGTGRGSGTTLESQINGGIIMGMGYALYEERVMDDLSGVVLNPNFETYKLPGIADVPDIEVVLINMPERGVIGIGEPATIADRRRHRQCRRQCHRRARRQPAHHAGESAGRARQSAAGQPP